MAATTETSSTTATGVRGQRRVLRPHQAQARDRLVRHLRRRARGLYVAATGSGKTLTAIRVAEDLGARLVLVVVPTLDLAAQTALAWRADGRREHMVIVSSMDTRGHDTLAAQRVGSTSDSEALAALMSTTARNHVRGLMVICTYDSLDKIEGTQHTGHTVPPFDLAIMDEAHRIAGRADKKWAVINDASRIRADRRLYMTATPRSFTAPELADSADTTHPRQRRSTTWAHDTAAALNSMDNPAVYGPTVHEYPLAQAIADGVAADYRIVVPTLTDTELRARLNLPTTSTSDNEAGPRTEDALRTTALHLAVLKAMTDHALRRVLVYFHRVEDAKRFTRELPHTLRQTRHTTPDTPPGSTPELFFVHGDHTPEQRTALFTRFAQADTAILANAKLISEGIDIPSVDAIVFADPTRSVIRCVQALGRALRPDVSGKTASLIVPAYVPPGADPEDILGTPYEPVWAITSALASHDHRILERLPNKTRRLSRETSRLIQRRWHFDFTTHPERIARGMDLIALNPRGPASRARREGLTAAQAFHDTHGHLDVPANYTDPVGYALGRFITTMREAHTAGRLDPDFAAELDALGMVWDKHKAAWRARLTSLADYHAAHGHLAIPTTTSDGAFLAEQRSHDHKGRLDPGRAAELDAIDPDWRLPYGPDWHRKYHLLRRHLESGHDPASIQPGTRLATVDIGTWLHRQFTRWTTLTDKQRSMLTIIGAEPATTPRPRRRRRSFEDTARILKLFLHRERRAPTARESITVDGEEIKIGPWLAKARHKQRAGLLPAAHSALMDELFDGDWTNDTAVPAHFDQRGR
ncbi:Helicase associated domain protein [Streptomyces sp. DSM 42041]|uniref:Helicase associated domain protein n=1 Tax=Streptomyces hazeniae TaxID=3075538 RepID=A0ABU2NZU2_9ACTN|nr:Helicase associated domain protein [Streptomyces sp. DSM 42041]MDT0382131.1 Helicase associated domain protein [Streptomyces sp. DSM 42041]